MQFKKMQNNNSIYKGVVSMHFKQFKCLKLFLVVKSSIITGVENIQNLEKLINVLDSFNLASNKT